jgi:hypothetical protein
MQQEEGAFLASTVPVRFWSCTMLFYEMAMLEMMPGLFLLRVVSMLRSTTAPSRATLPFTRGTMMLAQFMPTA